LGELEAGQLHPSPWEGNGANALASIPRHLQDKKGTSEPMWEGKEGHVVFLDFCKFLDMVSLEHIIFIGVDEVEDALGWEDGWVITKKCHLWYKVL